MPTHLPMRSAVRRGVLLAVLGAASAGLAGCSALDVSNPTIIEDETLKNSFGANSQWTMARLQFANIVSVAAERSGAFTDEFFHDQSADDYNNDQSYVDRRASSLLESQFPNGVRPFGEWLIARTSATIAIPRVRAYAQTGARDAQVGELFSIRGFVELRLAEDICAGFSLNEVVDFKPVINPALTTDEVFAHAIAQFDSAIANAGDSVRVINLARVGKARALLNRGSYAEAAAVAETVSPGFEWTVIPAYNEMSFSNIYYRPSVSDREGINGLDFVSAHDPRVVVSQYGTQLYGSDSTAPMYELDKYMGLQTPIVLANDIEAKLIVAEAQLQPAANPSGPWLETLNTLRRTVALSDTTDPGTEAGRVDLLFRERAFWLFGTGHRLGDLRRLIRQYGRDSETIFPIGPYRNRGISYSTGTRLPFPAAVESVGNPTVTGCTDE